MVVGCYPGCIPWIATAAGEKPERGYGEGERGEERRGRGEERRGEGEKRRGEGRGVWRRGEEGRTNHLRKGQAATESSRLEEQTRGAVIIETVSASPPVFVALVAISAFVTTYATNVFTSILAEARTAEVEQGTDWRSRRASRRRTSCEARDEEHARRGGGHVKISTCVV
eukprot:764124-Hanusia_phi.AAC.2